MNKKLSKTKKDAKTKQPPNAPRKDRKAIPYIIFALFAVFIAVGMMHHELWRDELEIYSRLAYTRNILMEGDISFICYYAVLKLFLLASSTEIMFQIAHFAFIGSALFLFLKYANISNLEKLLFSFGYFIVFDFGIISRYYGFMMLLIFLLILLMTKKERNYLLIVPLLLVLANHSIQSTILAAGFSLYLAGEFIVNIRRKKQAFNWNVLLSMAIFTAGWLAIAWFHFTITLKNSAYMGQGSFGAAPWLINFKSIWNAYVPIPNFDAGAAFWNTNIVNFTTMFPQQYNPSALYNGPTIFAIIISFLIVLVASAKFSEKPLVLLVYLFNTAVYLIFLQVTRVYFVRYQGILFLIFVSCYWLYKSSAVSINSPALSFLSYKPVSMLKGMFQPLLYCILVVQVVAGIFAYSMDYSCKFTMSQDAADYIVRHNLHKTHTMVGYMDYSAQTIAAHTHTKVYFPQVQHFAYYQEPFNLSRKREIPIPEILSACLAFTEKENQQVLLILTSPLMENDGQLAAQGMLSQQTGFTLLQSFTGNIIQPDEQFWLYEIKKEKPV